MNLLDLRLLKLTQSQEGGFSVPSFVRVGFNCCCNPLFEQMVFLQTAISSVSFAKSSQDKSVCMSLMEIPRILT